MLAQRQRSAPPARAVSTSLSAPVSGWNAKDALGDMDPLDAVVLKNWWPSKSSVSLRGGYTQHATGISGQVETVMSFNGLTANKLLAAAGTAIYDVTAGGAVGAAEQSGLVSARWQYINFANAGANYIYMVNGADAPRYWDGASWTNAAITGVTPENLIHINQIKKRLWFVEKDTLNAWYLATDAIAGAATKFALQGIASAGGYLVAMATWTIDAGYGVDDLAVYITSEGQVIVYRGTDPASSATWALVGVWDIGSPVGRRCFVKYGGDMLIITQDGLQPFAQYLQSSRTTPKIALTDKIQQAMMDAVTLYGSHFGWQVIQYPKQNAVILNVPIQEGNMQQQFAMSNNTNKPAWAQFTDWNANCWELFNDGLYFGGNGFVGKAWESLSDNGMAINADGLQAFNYFRSPAKLKRFTMMRPTLQTNGTPSILASLNIEFDTTDPTSPLSFTPTAYGAWDSGLWDTAIWGSDVVVSNAWQGATGVGYCAGVRLKVSASGITVRWVSTDIVAEPGAIL